MRGMESILCTIFIDLTGPQSRYTGLALTAWTSTTQLQYTTKATHRLHRG
jgi:hypothetical protein